MPQESYSDFSIIKDFIELKNRYDEEVREVKDKVKSMEEKFKKHAAALETEIKKRNDHIKACETKMGELKAAISEKDEQLKNLGLQLHRLKMSREAPGQSHQEENSRKKGFFSRNS